MEECFTQFFLVQISCQGGYNEWVSSMQYNMLKESGTGTGQKPMGKNEV